MGRVRLVLPTNGVMDSKEMKHHFDVVNAPFSSIDAVAPELTMSMIYIGDSLLRENNTSLDDRIELLKKSAPSWNNADAIRTAEMFYTAASTEFLRADMTMTHLNDRLTQLTVNKRSELRSLIARRRELVGAFPTSIELGTYYETMRERMYYQSLRTLLMNFAPNSNYELPRPWDSNIMGVPKGNFYTSYEEGIYRTVFPNPMDYQFTAVGLEDPGLNRISIHSLIYQVLDGEPMMGHPKTLRKAAFHGVGPSNYARRMIDAVESSLEWLTIKTPSIAKFTAGGDFGPPKVHDWVSVLWMLYVHETLSRNVTVNLKDFRPDRLYNAEDFITPTTKEGEAILSNLQARHLPLPPVHFFKNYQHNIEIGAVEPGWFKTLKPTVDFGFLTNSKTSLTSLYF